MRTVTLVPLLVLILDVVSSARITTKTKEVRGNDGRTHEAMIQAFGLPISSSDLTPFGDDPVIERLRNKNVKTTQRRFANPKDNSRREPSIQAYGLPKRTIESNGEIERVSVDRVSGLDGKVDKVHFRGDRPGVQAFGVTRRNQENNGVIERVGSNDEKLVTESTSGKGDGSFVRRVRSLDGYEENDLMDLEPQEAKVFRPLFVYRQQMADRYKLKGKKNPIYGGNRQRNSIHGYRKYN